MKLQDQVISFEQAKRLKELGVRAETFWEWLECAEFDEDGSKVIKWHPVLFYNHELDMFSAPGDYSHLMNDDGDFHETKGNAPAFTVAELGVMLPDGGDCRGKHWAQFQTFRVIKGVQSSQQWCCYCDESSPSGSNEYGDDVYRVAKKVYGHTEAEARATMLIYLLENNLTTASECNKRLTT